MYRSGFVGLFGFPNSGKSTLINCLIGEKVAIVTPKPQTTRKSVNGILSSSNSQIVFVDTPGFVEGPQNFLNEFLGGEIERTLEDVDVGLFLLGADQTEKEQAILEWKSRFKKPALVVLTKADLLRSNPQSSSNGPPALSISVSKNPKGAVEVIRQAVESLLPETAAPLFDPELYTTQNSRDLAAEIVREKCFLNLEQEVPYQLAVSVRSYKEGERIQRIECDILVHREGHKGIVIGEGARKLKKIGSEARRDLEKVLGTKVHLGLHVSHKANWMKSPLAMKDLGYVKHN